MTRLIDLVDCGENSLESMKTAFLKATAEEEKMEPRPRMLG